MILFFSTLTMDTPSEIMEMRKCSPSFVQKVGRKYENLVGLRFVEGLKKEPMLSLSELVDLKVHYKEL